ncbi:MAG TPA: PIN domain-containing protein [Terriglobales bacterium]|nr:PIN domain-containing protein [Terriglobales bacterium]
MRIVLDTNVIISALVFGGLPRRIVDLAAFGLCDLFYSSQIEEEGRRVLADKFGLGSKGTRQPLANSVCLGNEGGTAGKIRRR